MKEPAGADDDVEVSAIIPVGARHATDLLALFADYKSALDALGVRYEVIVVLDGPRPELAADVQRLLASGASIAVIGLTRRFGEATALVAGFQRARGRTSSHCRRITRSAAVRSASWCGPWAWSISPSAGAGRGREPLRGDAPQSLPSHAGIGDGPAPA